MTAKTQLREIKARDIMTSKVQSVMMNDSVQDAMKLMIDIELATLPVINFEEKCVGILSRSDLNELFLQEDSELARLGDSEGFPLRWLSQNIDTFEDRQVKEVMTYDVEKVTADEDLVDVCKTMIRQKIHHLPVVDNHEKVVGIISALDVVAAVSEVE